MTTITHYWKERITMNLRREIFDNLYGNSATCDLCQRRVLAMDLSYNEETDDALCDQCY